MRFEEVSPPIESRIIALATVAAETLVNEVYTLMGVFNATRDEVNGVVHLLDTTNVIAAATRAFAPGGLTSLLLAAAIILRILQFALVSARASRLTGVALELANSEATGKATHNKDV